MFKVAEKLLEDNGLPKTTKIVKLVEGTETAIFKQYFTHWNETEDSIGRSQEARLFHITEKRAFEIFNFQQKVQINKVMDLKKVKLFSSGSCV